MVGNDIKELVRTRTDIVSLISESHGLTAKGPNYSCLCPFHDDHNPSLMVYPDRQSFRCWSCNEGGDAFAWVMKRENVGFPDALRILAERANIDLPKVDKAEFKQKAGLYDVLKWAEAELHNCFLHAPEAEVARQYVKQQRGYSDETISEFRIGYHPADWEWFIRRAAKQFEPELLEQARLVKKRDKGGYYDYFVDRVIFPIHDERGRPVAFGGRVIPGRESKDAPKYFNSPESDIFSKSRILYGLPEARSAIAKEQSVIVVEGYADCVACHQFGVRNVVATLGTALTEQQCERLRAFAPKVVLLYDADEAGQKAAERATELLIGQSVDMRVANLPSGKDPDDFLKASGVESFRGLIDAAPEAWEFRFNREVQKRGLDALASRSDILVELLKIVAQTRSLSGSAKESLIVGRLSARLSVPVSEVRDQLARMRGDAKPATNAYRQPEKLSRDDMLESELIEIMLAAPQFALAVRESVGADDFRNPGLKRLAQAIFDLCELGIEPTFGEVMGMIDDPALKSLAVIVSDRGVAKEIAGKLAGDNPPIVAENIAAMVARREAGLHREFVERTALSGAGNAAEMLRRATEFHRRRTRVASEIR